MTVAEFIAKWSASGAAERAKKDSFLIDLCDLLGVPRPHATSGDPDKDTYKVRETLQASKRSLSAPEAAKLFKGAKLTEVEAVLESLSSLGLVLSFESGGVRRWRAGAR